jgi:methyl-accepting chemotaxis protein
MIYIKIVGENMNTKKITIIFFTYFMVFGTLYAQIKEDKIDEYNSWLDSKKKMIDEIGDSFIIISNRDDIEKECIKFVEHGLFMNIYVAFSNNTMIFGDLWIPPDNYLPTERSWYRLAMNANGKTVETEIYEYSFSGEMLITIVKKIGLIDGLTAVIGADIIIPDHFFIENKNNVILKLLQYLYKLKNN